MKLRSAAVWLALATGLPGCSSILPKAPPEAYYDLKYESQQVPCARSYPSPVEVWDFSATAPYDRSQMVVTEGREVSFSHGHQWVARPGVLVAQRLMRDLDGGGLFLLALSPSDPHPAALQLAGTLYRFAWEKEGDSARASLEADVVLSRTGADAEVLLHHRYDVRSEPSPASGDARAFARAMSGVVERFSTLVRTDLCGALDGGQGGDEAAGRE